MGIKLTVFFEGPFWVGVFERNDGGKYETARVVFGAEPRDHEVQELILLQFKKLRFTRPAVSGAPAEAKRLNPKRLLREVHREVAARGTGTKAQQALKLEYEAIKLERRTMARAVREEAAEMKYLKKRRRKKEKLKGR